MTANGYGAIAIVTIVFCMLIAVYLFPIAAWAGFNAIVVGMFLALLASVVASFYLLANRQELPPQTRRRVATIALAALLLAISPVLVAVTVALRS